MRRREDDDAEIYYYKDQSHDIDIMPIMPYNV